MSGATDTNRATDGRGVAHVNRTADANGATTVTGEPSVLDPATLRAYRETDYLVLLDPAVTLRIDRPSSALAIMQAQYLVSSSAFVTACNPLGELVDAGTNERYRTRLIDELERIGIPFVEGVGRHPSGNWPGEASVLAFGLDLDAARALGRRHSQNAILWSGSDAIPRLVLLR